MRYRRKKLDNGINLITITGLPTQAVTISAFLKAGCRFDPIDKPGLAHFTEHMAFTKTKSFKNSQILANAIEQHGGYHSAFTWIDHQSHTIHLPKNYFRLGAKVLYETIFNLIIDELEIEKEKRVIKEEILRNRTDPSKAIWDYVWFPLFFQGTPLARPYSGEDKDIDVIIGKDVELFISKNFLPQNTVIIIAGDVDEKESYITVNKYFGQINSNNLNSKKNLSISYNHKSNILAFEDNAYYRSSLVIGIKTVPFNSTVRYIFDVIREMLGGYFGSPLIYKLREKGGLIYDWKIIHDNLLDAGYLSFIVSTAHENVSRVMDIILNEFKRFEQGNFSKTEVEIAKNHLIGNLKANIETGRDFIRWYGLQELLLKEKVVSVDKAIEIYKKISRKQIGDITSKYFSKRDILVGSIGKTQ